MIAHVPDMFRPRIRVEYPPDNKQIFEEWFFDNVRSQDIPGDRVYLPVFFCSFQVNNDYGKGRKMADLQSFIDGLDRSKKYFTITQYDDGPLVDFKDLDIKVFGSGGGRIDCAIPLVCMPHPYHHVIPMEHRSFLASFIGSITHPIRQKMIDVIQSLPYEQRVKYYISTKHHTIEEYCKIMSESKFALCPRGYGKTSFRICEALQYGAIPMYISDEFINPFPYHRGLHDEFGMIGLHEEWLHKLHSSLTELPNPDMWQIEGSFIYDKYFKYDSLKNEILEWLKRL